jgi:hypothetical protein
MHMQMYTTVAAVHADRHIPVYIYIHMYIKMGMYGTSNNGRVHPRRRPEAAHTVYKVVTDAVFHSSMFALNADAEKNVCKPNHTPSTPTESARKFSEAYTHTHPHTWTSACLHVWCMRIGDMFDYK